MDTDGFPLTGKAWGGGGHEVDYSHPTNAEVKKMCIYNSALPYVLMSYA
jgi:hypothetical protein